ncbi:sensor histidine kinase [Oceanirhabdus sp. W0125-5]|uniref:sensor histidine kinase n=1 Tax=Oceanirhabdus sp. W0125-5 TaxID=2999116 RepID=UPI0022F2B351|nr:HAMP domain-containing sensor histidine kinase [Oceanirhabdus sp. W0125-5]WBW99078.1 HAMP domain-containing sensor histidine kinase [Oceanirhabdus sp. W0125-5]
MKSIKGKLFIQITLMVLSFVLLFSVVNTVFYRNYYMYKKEKSLIEISGSISKAYDNDYHEVNEIMEYYENKKNTFIVITDSSGNLKYSTLERIREDIKGGGKTRLIPPLLSSDKVIDSKIIDESRERYVVRDKNMQVDFLVINEKMNNGDELSIRVPLEAFKESVIITNQFALAVGIVIIIIGVIWAYYLSKRFTKPILVLNDIAKKMSQLNFEETVDVNQEDEIGQLGNNINKLSYKLEMTINELNNKNRMLIDEIKIKQEIDETRKEFIYAVSHELKTPIALIRGYADALKLDIMENPQDKDFYCEVIVDESCRMDSIVKELMSLLEMESGQYKLEKSSIDIYTLIDYDIAKFSNILKEKNINVDFENKGNIEVLVDPMKIEQVIVNYLNNAINHVDNNKKIKISIEEKEDKVRVFVYNSGKNIEEDKIKRIWEHFYKVDKARAREYGGSGLGLSIVKAVQNLHGNDFGVFNVPDGVVFWFDVEKSE